MQTYSEPFSISGLINIRYNPNYFSYWGRGLQNSFSRKLLHLQSAQTKNDEVRAGCPKLGHTGRVTFHYVPNNTSMHHWSPCGYNICSLYPTSSPTIVLASSVIDLSFLPISFLKIVHKLYFENIENPPKFFLKIRKI